MPEYSTPAPAERLRLILAADLSSTEKLVLAALSHHVGRDGWAWPSQQTLSRETSFTPDTIGRTLQKLGTRGIVTSKPRGRGRMHQVAWHRMPATPDRESDVENATPEGRSDIDTPIPEGKSDEHPIESRTSCPETRSRVGQNTYVEHLCGTHGGGSSEMRVPKPSRSRGGWPGGDIRPDELQDIGQAEARFREAVASGWIAEADHLRFLTLWLYVARLDVRSPGAVLTALVKRREWHGSNADEDAAREHIRQASRRRPPEGGIVGSVAAALAPPEDLISAGRNLDNEP